MTVVKAVSYYDKMLCIQGSGTSVRFPVSQRAELCALIGLLCLAGHVWAQGPPAPSALPDGSLQRPTASSRPSDNLAAARYLIAKDDLLDIEVLGAQELSREYRVDGDGMIVLPMLAHPVIAEGLTLDQLSQSIRKDLLDAGLFTDPQVTVSVKSSARNTVVLSGAAKKPGVYPVYGHTTLLELLNEAEGLSDDAGSVAYVTRSERPWPGQETNASSTETSADASAARTLKVEVWRLWQNGDATLDVNLYPGDRVTVQRAGVVYVIGGVTRAGGFPLSNEEEKMTILQAIALAGSLTPQAKPANAVILRKSSNAPGGRQEIKVNLKKVLANQTADQQLLANDILYVPESGVKRALGTVVNTALGATIWRMPL